MANEIGSTNCDSEPSLATHFCTNRCLSSTPTIGVLSVGADADEDPSPKCAVEAVLLFRLCLTLRTEGDERSLLSLRSDTGLALRVLPLSERRNASDAWAARLLLRDDVRDLCFFSALSLLIADTGRWIVKARLLWPPNNSDFSPIEF